MNEKLEEVIGYYAAYFCGVIDTLVEHSEILSAADYKTQIEEVLESIAKDGYALGQESKK